MGLIVKTAGAREKQPGEQLSVDHGFAAGMCRRSLGFREGVRGVERLGKKQRVEGIDKPKVDGRLRMAQRANGLPTAGEVGDGFGGTFAGIRSVARGGTFARIHSSAGIHSVAGIQSVAPCTFARSRTSS